MGATYRALCKHGYASLRMQDIADESTKSKATLHYHYGGKHDLLLAFLDYLFERFEARIADPAGDGPTDRLVALIGTLLTPRDENTHQEFQTAILEIKAQGPYDDDYRERLVKFDRLLEERLRSLVADGVERGAFREDVDPEDVADFFVTAINGAQTRHVSVGHPIERTRRHLESYVDAHLLRGGSGARAAPE
ncbi:TetR/AcrR family transcriptional regulator [Halegenticoccus tardaugens]|uniref:TetR/AcrR family transcriptional regulator n=1 Tax=Halegenticoccus tardaugens TaxID=2071624 RepID=UPI00100AC287